MSINLNSFANNEEPAIVFNGGNAGRVKNVQVSVKLKTPEDKPNSPDARIFVTDSEGGNINLGIYYPTDRTTDKEISIRLNQMVSFLTALNPALAGNLPEFNTNMEAYKYLITQIAKNANAGLVNVFTAYGTTGRPSTYLNFRAFNIVEPANTPDDKTQLKPNTTDGNYKDIMVRPKPTEDFNNESSAEVEKGQEVSSSGDEIDWTA